MAKGGHPNSGPAPDPNALRRDRDKGEWTILPIEGRGDVPAPTWPFQDADPYELTVWAEMWAKPQAVMWERNGQHREVAIFVRNLVTVERGAPVSHGTLLRQQFEALGLSVPGLRANRWVIPRDEVKTKRVENAAQIAEPRGGSRDRLRAIRGERTA